MALYPSNSETSLGFTITYDTAGVTTPAQLNFNKTRAAGALADNDYVGRLHFFGDDGDSTEECARIEVRALGTVADTRMPGELSFYTRADTPGASIVTGTYRMNISPAGNVTIAAPDAGVGLTIAGGGLSVTGALLLTLTTFTVTASAASATAIDMDATNAAGGVRIRAGTGGITLGDEADCTTFAIGSVAPTATRTTTIAAGTVVTAAVTDTINIGTGGATTNANSIKTVNIATGGVTLGENNLNLATGNRTSGTHLVNISTGTGTKVVNVGNADALTTMNIDATTLINDSINVQTSINTGTSTGAVVIGNAAAGAMSMDTAAGISLDAATVSNFTVTGAGQDLNLLSVGGSVLVSATENIADAIYLHANGGVNETIRVHADQGTLAGSIELLSDLGGVTITATGNATADAINLNAPLGGVDIDGSLAIDIQSAAAGVSIDGVLASNFTVTGAAQDLTLASVGGSVNVNASENAAQAIYLHANGGVLETIQLHADQGTDVASIELLSDLGGITLTATGNATADAINLNAPAGGVDIDGSLAIDIASAAAGVSIDGVLASNFTVTGAGQDLTLSSAGGSVLVSSTENAADAIYLHADGGVLETIRLHADQGTDVASVQLLSDLGGITLTATGNATADAINLSAPAGGIDMDGALAIDINSTAAGVSIDGVLASNFTVTGAGQDLSLTSVGGSVIIDGSEAAANAIVINASNVAGGINVDCGTNGFDLYAVGGPISIDAEGTANFTTTGAFDLTVASTAGSININAGEAAADAINIDASAGAGGIDIDSGTGGITVDSTGVLSLDAAGATNLTTTGAFDITVQSTAGSIILNAGEAAGDAIVINASNAAGGVDILTGTGGLGVIATGGDVTITAGTGTNGTLTLNSTGTGDIILNSDDTMLLDADGVLELNSSGGIIGIGNDADANDINIGTGAAQRVITIGNGTAASQVDINAGTGNINIGVNAIARDIVVGNGTGASSLSMYAGTGAINIGTNGIAHTTTIGNNVGASSVIVDCGTGAAQFAANGIAHDTTVGSATGAATTTIQAGTGTLNLTSTQAIDFTAGAATGIMDANGMRIQSNYRVNAVRTGGAQAVGAAAIVVFDTEGFDPGADYDNATGVFTAPATGIYRISAVVNCTDVVGGGTKTIALRDGGVATNYTASATVGNTLLGSLSLDVLYELTAGDTIDIYWTGGAGDTVANGSHLMVEFAYNA